MDSPLGDSHLQVALVERDQEVQTFAPQGPAQALAYGVCLWCPHRCSQYAHAQRGHSSVQLLGKDAIPIVDHESVRMVARKCLSELLQRPFRRKMGGHVVMENSPGTHFHQHEYVKGAEGG